MEKELRFSILEHDIRGVKNDLRLALDRIAVLECGQHEPRQDLRAALERIALLEHEQRGLKEDLRAALDLIALLAQQVRALASEIELNRPVVSAQAYACPATVGGSSSTAAAATPTRAGRIPENTATAQDNLAPSSVTSDTAKQIKAADSLDSSDNTKKRKPTITDDTGACAKKKRTDNETFEVSPASDSIPGGAEGSKKEHINGTQKEKAFDAGKKPASNERARYRILQTLDGKHSLNYFVQVLSDLQKKNDNESIAVNKLSASIQRRRSNFLTDLSFDNLDDYIDVAKERVDLVLHTTKDGKTLIRLASLSRPWRDKTTAQITSGARSSVSHTGLGDVDRSGQASSFGRSMHDLHYARRNLHALRYEPQNNSDVPGPDLRPDDVDFVILLLERHGKKIEPMTRSRYLSIREISSLMCKLDWDHLQVVGYSDLYQFARKVSGVANLWLTDTETAPYVLWLIDYLYPFRYKSDSEAYWSRNSKALGAFRLSVIGEVKVALKNHSEDVEKKKKNGKEEDRSLVAVTSSSTSMLSGEKEGSKGSERGEAQRSTRYQDQIKHFQSPTGVSESITDEANEDVRSSAKQKPEAPTPTPTKVRKVHFVKFEEDEKEERDQTTEGKKMFMSNTLEAWHNMAS